MICKCETLNITEKNDEQILVTVMRGFENEASENESEGTPQPFPVEISTDIDVKLTTPRADRLPIDFTVGDEGRILIDLKADRVKAGTTYGLEVTGQVNGSRWCAIGDSVIRITRTTERGPKQVKVDADPYEVTLWAGYVGDVVPRHLRDLEGYAALTQLLDAMGETLGKKADTEDVTNALKNIIDRFKEYVPTSDKGKAGGVATLDGLGKILAAQLNMPWRGNFEGNFQASDTEPGIWGVDNRVIGPKPLNGEAAHGVMLVFPDRYKTTIFLVGPPNGAAAGNAPEIYARRWMTGSKSWTNWLTTANFARKDEIPQEAEYALAKDFYSLQLIKDGKVQSEVKNLYPPMSLSDALMDTDWVQQNHHSITQSVLRKAIEHRTKDKATIDFVNSSIQTATAEFRGTHHSLEALQAVEADRNDYGYVEETDTDGNILIHRYKYVEGTGWLFEYDLNRTGFTAAEWQAIKSGITPEDVEKLRELPTKEQLEDEKSTSSFQIEGYEAVPFDSERKRYTCKTGYYSKIESPLVLDSEKKVDIYLDESNKIPHGYIEFSTPSEKGFKIQFAWPDNVGKLLFYGDYKNLKHNRAYVLEYSFSRDRRTFFLEFVEKAKTPVSMEDLADYALKSDTLDRYKVGEEVLIGEWEENGVAYDLYRKVVSFGNLPNAEQKTVAHGIADKVKFTRVTAMASNGFPIPFVTQDPAKAIYLALGNNNITINTHATDRSALTADVTIEFTREKIG